MGVNFVKGKIGTINEKENGNLILRYEDINEGTVKEKEHDLVILSVGVLPNTEVYGLFSENSLKKDDYSFVQQKDILYKPALSNIKGVFLAGTTTGPMDIPDTILSAGSAALEAINYIKQSKNYEK
jgi:heterodisulfide reductase subunit A